MLEYCHDQQDLHARDSVPLRRGVRHVVRRVEARRMNTIKAYHHVS